LLPPFLAILKDLLPPAVSTIVAKIPTATLARVLRGSFSRNLASLTFDLELLVSRHAPPWLA